MDGPGFHGRRVFAAIYFVDSRLIKRPIGRYFHIISRNVLLHIQISEVKIVTGFYEG